MTSSDEDLLDKSLLGVGKAESNRQSETLR